MALSGYPPGVELRPLVGWPGALTPAGKRRRAQFASTFTDTMTLLERELRMYDQKDSQYPTTVLQIAIGERDLRRDGLPRASCSPDHPGIVLSVEPKFKPRLSLPCDTFLHWHDNVRAVALTLESLRKIERYGVTQNDEQYRGWQALPPGASAIVMGPKSPFAGDPDAALAHIAEIGRVPHGQNGARPAKDKVSTMFRAAQGETHPDRGGDRNDWDKVVAAGDVLKAAGWL